MQPQTLTPEHELWRSGGTSSSCLTPYTPTPYSLHPSRCTLHPTPCTVLHSTPYTLQPTPCNLHPTPLQPLSHLLLPYIPATSLLPSVSPTLCYPTPLQPLSYPLFLLPSVSLTICLFHPLSLLPSISLTLCLSYPLSLLPSVCQRWGRTSSSEPSSRSGLPKTKPKKSHLQKAAMQP